MRISLDWLSVTVRTAKNVDISILELMKQITDLMHLTGYYKKAVLVGSQKFYGSIFRIDDISFKLAREKEGACYKQGVMIEFTSTGLCNYIHFLTDNKLTLTDVLRNLRALTMAGYIVNYPRLDVAMDDIHLDGERPVLRLERISRAWHEHLFCSRARANMGEQKQDFDDTDKITTGKICFKKKGELIGQTVYFGNRKSKVCVRFYDKLVEQLQKGRKVPKNITHWVRCEYEFHNERACSIVAMLIDNNFGGFKRAFCECVMGHLRFINPDDSNRSRCSTCSWWQRFLDNVCHAENFTIPPKKDTSAGKTIGWLRRSVFPTLYAYVATLGAENMLNEVAESKDRLGFKQLQFISDFVDCDEDSDPSSELYDVIFWATLSHRPINEVLDEMRTDCDNLQLCKRYRSQINGSTADIVRAVLRLAGDFGV